MVLEQSTEKFRNEVDQYIIDLVEKRKFSGSILIAKEGNIILDKGYGMANYELDVPNTPKTKFLIGSITKQFTAIAICKLVKEGKLSFSDKLNKFISDFPKGDTITIHHLLTHTSGIFNYTNDPNIYKIFRNHYTPEEIIATFKERSLEFEPGSQFAYSNSGYILLGYIIQLVSGIPYDQYIEEYIIHPLQMKNSGYASNTAILKNRASGYALEGENLVNAAFIDMSLPYAAGGLYSTVEDLYLWNKKILDKNEVAPEYMDIVLQEHVDRGEVFGEKSYYGYGWDIVNRKDSNVNEQTILHAGGTSGFISMNAVYLDSDTHIIFLSNFVFIDYGNIYKDLEAIVFGIEQKS